MGVKISEGAIIGARAAVFKDVKPWTVSGGNPAIFIKDRVYFTFLIPQPTISPYLLDFSPKNLSNNQYS